MCVVSTNRQHPTTSYAGRNVLRILKFVRFLHERTKLVGPFGSIDIQDGQVRIFKGSLERTKNKERKMDKNGMFHLQSKKSERQTQRQQ
jgi:hypothetical protein